MSTSLDVGGYSECAFYNGTAADGLNPNYQVFSGQIWAFSIRLKAGPGLEQGGPLVRPILRVCTNATVLPSGNIDTTSFPAGQQGFALVRFPNAEAWNGFDSQALTLITGNGATWTPTTDYQRKAMSGVMDGNWHHIMGEISGSGTIRQLFLDGVKIMDSQAALGGVAGAHPSFSHGMTGSPARRYALGHSSISNTFKAADFALWTGNDLSNAMAGVANIYAGLEPRRVSGTLNTIFYQAPYRNAFRKPNEVQYSGATFQRQLELAARSFAFFDSDNPFSAVNYTITPDFIAHANTSISGALSRQLNPNNSANAQSTGQASIISGTQYPNSAAHDQSATQSLLEAGLVPASVLNGLTDFDARAFLQLGPNFGYHETSDNFSDLNFNASLLANGAALSLLSSQVNLEPEVRGDIARNSVASTSAQITPRLNATGSNLALASKQSRVAFAPRISSYNPPATRTASAPATGSRTGRA